MLDVTKGVTKGVLRLITSMLLKILCELHFISQLLQHEHFFLSSLPWFCYSMCYIWHCNSPTFLGSYHSKIDFHSFRVNLVLICSKIYQYLLLIWIFHLFFSFLSFPTFHSFSDWYFIALISPTRARIHPILYHPQILNLEIWQVKIFLDLNFPAVVL